MRLPIAIITILFGLTVGAVASDRNGNLVPIDGEQPKCWTEDMVIADQQSRGASLSAYYQHEKADAVVARLDDAAINKTELPSHPPGAMPYVQVWKNASGLGVVVGFGEDGCAAFTWGAMFEVLWKTIEPGDPS